MSRIGKGVRGAVAVAVSLAACLAEAKQLKVLAIGNSFSLSMMGELPKAAAAYPGCELDIAHLMIGGCTFERHWKNVEKAVKDPSFRPYGVTASYAFDKERAEKFPKKANVPEMLVADRWDIVTIQQGSRECWSYETYQPFAGNLIAKIRELAPQAEIRIQQTWSYSPYSRRLEGWKLTPETMYKALKEAYGRLASDYAFAVIPTGDAVQLYRENLPVKYGKILSTNEVAALSSPADINFHGDVVGAAGRTKKGNIRVDAHHLNAEGKYLQACVWLAALFEVDVTKLTYEPAIEGFAPRARLMRRCAAAAVRGRKLAPDANEWGERTEVRDIDYLDADERTAADSYRRRMCKLDLAYPKGVTGFPTVVWFHGGGLTRGNKHFPRIDARRVGVITANYRLMGKNGITNAAPALTDAAAAVAWTIRHIAEYGGDPKRVFVSGASGGGYLTMMIGMDPQWLAKYGFKPTDLAGLAPNTGQATTHFGVKAMRKDPRPGPNPVIDEWSPLGHCTTNMPPILCLSGQPGYEWPGRAEENELLIGTLKTLGHKKAWYVRLPYATHGWMSTCANPFIELFVLGKFPGQ